MQTRRRDNPVHCVMARLAMSLGLDPLAWLEMPYAEFQRRVRARAAS